MTGEALRESWQGRSLRLAARNIQLRAALVSLFADNYDETLPFLLASVFGDWAIAAPFYCSNPRIDRAGHIVADLIMPDGMKLKDAIIFAGERQMERLFRKLADRLRFTDAERIDLFVAVRHWVKADRRLDPNFDRSDPDAKRLVLH